MIHTMVVGDVKGVKDDDWMLLSFVLSLNISLVIWKPIEKTMPPGSSRLSPETMSQCNIDGDSMADKWTVRREE